MGTRYYSLETKERAEEARKAIYDRLYGQWFICAVVEDKPESLYVDTELYLPRQISVTSVRVTEYTDGTRDLVIDCGKIMRRIDSAHVKKIRVDAYGIKVVSELHYDASKEYCFVLKTIEPMSNEYAYLIDAPQTEEGN